MSPFWIGLIFTTAAGACVGSFLNVVILRLPAGQSIVSPPSRDPATGDRLKWWENIPVLSWLLLGGKSRYSGQRISVQYPLIEVLTAVLFGGLYWIYFATDLRPAFSQAGLISDFPVGTWPIFLVHLVLIACLIAATVIDAKFFIIPLSITWIATLVAWIIPPVATDIGLLPPGFNSTALTPVTTWGWLTPSGWLTLIFATLGGIAIAGYLLWWGFLPRSFADEAQYLSEEAQADVNPHQVISAYPHPRREMLKELAFLSIPVLCGVLGLLLMLAIIEGPLFQFSGPGPTSDLPLWLLVLGGVIGSYLVGGALIWVTRILGTLAFGKEAMGLGDVHLLAAIGAVLGPGDTVLTFFIAPFMGLLAAAVMSTIAAVRREGVRVIPYGPYLAAAALAVMIWRNELWLMLGF